MPFRTLTTRLADHPGTDGHDQTSLLSNRDEIGRRDQAPFGMLPSEKRLHTLEISVQIYLRLVKQLQLVILESASQTGFSFEPLFRPAFQICIVEGVAVSPSAFGA